MNGATDMVTVYRTMDEGGKEEAVSVRELLERSGVPAVLVDDEAPNVVQGAYEIRVYPQDQARAEELINQAPDDDDLAEPDPSHQYDQETVFSAEGTTAEMEAIAVQGVLSANGIGAIIVGSSSLPNFPFEVKVAAEDAAAASECLAEARAAGPAAAEEAERATES